MRSSSQTTQEAVDEPGPARREPEVEPAPAPHAPDHAEAAADYWHARYVETRERLAKLWVAYKDLEAQLHAAPVAEPAPTVIAPTVVGQETSVPFTYGDYTLYARDVKLKNGGTRTIHFFAKRKPKSGQPSPMPEGYEVSVSKKTGLPFLQTLGGSHASQKHYQPQCGAITADGAQCRNSAREGSKYCGSHVGYQPKTAAALLESADTSPVAEHAPDTHPTLGRGGKIVVVTPRGKLGNGESATLQPQCAALTGEGVQCRNSASEGSKFCGVHHGHRGDTVENMMARRDTKPRVRKARDTKPSVRRSGRRR